MGKWTNRPGRRCAASQKALKISKSPVLKTATFLGKMMATKFKLYHDWSVLRKKSHSLNLWNSSSWCFVVALFFTSSWEVKKRHEHGWISRFFRPASETSCGDNSSNNISWNDRSGDSVGIVTSELHPLIIPLLQMNQLLLKAGSSRYSGFCHFAQYSSIRIITTSFNTGPSWIINTNKPHASWSCFLINAQTSTSTHSWHFTCKIRK